MQLKCRVLKIKVECRSNQNKSHACTFDQNFDQAYSESLISRVVLCVFGTNSIKFVCNLKHRLNVKLTVSILRHYVCYKDTIITINDISQTLKYFPERIRTAAIQIIIWKDNKCALKCIYIHTMLENDWTGMILTLKILPSSKFQAPWRVLLSP